MKYFALSGLSRISSFVEIDYKEGSLGKSISHVTWKRIHWFTRSPKVQESSKALSLW